MLREIFYFTGILFFVIVILVGIIFLRKTSQTASQIKKMLTSKELEDLILQVKNGVSSSFRALSRG